MHSTRHPSQNVFIVPLDNHFLGHSYGGFVVIDCIILKHCFCPSPVHVNQGHRILE